ncbi:MAG: DUF2202 domain-containing protein [Methanocellales archaeon]|nr:DUF2202 domain-containing protein [Methanocellales archaeon]
MLEALEREDDPKAFGRRKFIKSLAIAGAIATMGIAGCVSEPEPTPAPSVPTRTAPALPAAPTAAPAATPRPAATPSHPAEQPLPTPAATPTLTQPKKVSQPEPTDEWKPDGLVGENEYAKTMILYGLETQGYSGGKLEISWKNDEDSLYMALKGETSGWISIGFEPTQWMKDTDMIMGAVDGDNVTVLDKYSTNDYGPHVPDGELGGTDDILDYGGREENGYTIIEFKRKMDTGDQYDKAFTVGQRVSIIWSMADADSIKVMHNVARGEGILELESEALQPLREEPVQVKVPLTTTEIEGILLIREEEKMARDLYLDLYDKEKLTIFLKVANSEQNHMDSIKILIDRYSLQDPVQEERGLFTNQTIQALYDQQTEIGKRSLEDALGAGATVEEVSILHLEEHIGHTDREDIIVAYEGLLTGSQKHMRSFVSSMDTHGYEYTPHFLSQEEYDQIVSGS